jgi:hypothetical protein
VPKVLKVEKNIIYNIITILTLTTLGTLVTPGTQLLNYPRNYDKFAAESINPDYRWLFNVELLG